MRRLLLYLLVAALLPAPAAHARSTVIASGLDRPRGLAFGPDGTLFATLVGHGPSAPSRSNCDDAYCYGASGRIVRVARDGTTRDVVTGLLSARGRPDGFYSLGVDAVTVLAGGRVASVVSAEMVPPSGITPRQVPRSLRDQVGRVFTKAPGRRAVFGTKVSAREFRDDIRHDGRSSDPYGIAAIGDRLFVSDAGANALLEPRGATTRVVTTFPDARNHRQPVPDAVTAGPDGALYVGEFVGGAEDRIGEARIWRVTPDGRRRLYARGFTTITALAAGTDGSLYVAELAPGRITRLAPDGTRTVLADDVRYPGGVAVARDGTVYATAWTIAGARPATSGEFAGRTGQIVRIG